MEHDRKKSCTVWDGPKTTSVRSAVTKYVSTSLVRMPRLEREVREQLKEEVRIYKQISLTYVSQKWLWVRELLHVSVGNLRKQEERLGVIITGFPKARARVPFKNKANTAVNGSFKGVAGRYAACGWAVQLDFNESGKPWYAMNRRQKKKKVK